MGELFNEGEAILYHAAKIRIFYRKFQIFVHNSLFGHECMFAGAVKTNNPRL